VNLASGETLDTRSASELTLTGTAWRAPCRRGYDEPVTLDPGGAVRLRRSGCYMKTIHTGCGSFLTGGEIADAVSGLGLALARVRDLDVVDIPFVAVDGAVSRAQFRIGWQIDTVVTDDGLSSDELIDVHAIFDLLERTQALTTTQSRARLQRTAREHDLTNWDEFI